MKQILLLVVSLTMVTGSLLAQDDHRNCGMQEHMTELLQDEEYKQRHQEILRSIHQKISEQAESRAQCNDPVMIPMAVHYQRLKGKNYDKNCLIQLAQSQIDILNQDYGGYNMDISNWTGGASSSFPGVNNGEACIEFCLATTGHPAGYDLNEGEPAVTFNKTSGDRDANWSGYVNIFVRNISYLGYSPLGGQGNGDGVVIDDNAFGSGNGCGSISPNAPYNLGRTLTHELGHYLLLDHIWGPGSPNSPNCNDSDNVGDTPNQSMSYGGCPGVGISSCGSADLHMNYMDYTYDACMYMFTAGQATRMETYVASNLSHVVNNGLSVCGGIVTGPTCTDGMMNGNETGIDCGGPDCPPCNTGSCDVPTGLASAKERGGSRLRLSWNGVGAANAYDVDIRLAGTTSWDSYSTTNTTITISGLIKKRTYEWRVRSVCDSGTSAWANASAQTRENIFSNELQVFPNPTQNTLSINVSSLESFDSAKDVKISVLDLTGSTVMINQHQIVNQISLDVSDVSNGTYILHVQLDNQVVIEKFTILK